MPAHPNPSGVQRGPPAAQHAPWQCWQGISHDRLPALLPSSHRHIESHFLQRGLLSVKAQRVSSPFNEDASLRQHRHF
eukprot:jgi/Botrbrau1/16526/Bobra.0282s0002.1